MTKDGKSRTVSNALGTEPEDIKEYPAEVFLAPSHGTGYQMLQIVIHNFENQPINKLYTLFRDFESKCSKLAEEIETKVAYAAENQHRKDIEGEYGYEYKFIPLPRKLKEQPQHMFRGNSLYVNFGFLQQMEGKKVKQEREIGEAYDIMFRHGARTFIAQKQYGEYKNFYRVRCLTGDYDVHDLIDAAESQLAVTQDLPAKFRKPDMMSGQRIRMYDSIYITAKGQVLDGILERKGYYWFVKYSDGREEKLNNSDGRLPSLDYNHQDDIWEFR